MSSKTARKSQVQEVSKAKVVIPDAEMVRQFRLNTEAGVFTSNMEFYRAAFRRIDELESLLAVAYCKAITESSLAQEQIAEGNAAYARLSTIATDVVIAVTAE
jgi:hypothetical protein